MKATAASRFALAALICASGQTALAADVNIAPPMMLDTNIEWDTGVSTSGTSGPARVDSAAVVPVAARALNVAKEDAGPAPMPAAAALAPVPAPASAISGMTLPLPLPSAPAIVASAPSPVPAPDRTPIAAAVLFKPQSDAVRMVEQTGPPNDPAPIAMAPAGAPPAADLAEATERDGPVAAPGAPAAAQAPGDTESLRDAIIASLKSNPDIQIALAQQDDARFGIDQAQSGYMPHVDMTVGYGPEIARQGVSASTRRNRVEGTVTVSQNLWDWGVTINDIKRARASYRAAQWATREQIESISFDITNAYLGILQQQKLIALTNEEIAATRKLLRMITVQKELGLTTQADVDRAKARVENVESTLLDRKSALQQARDTYKQLTDHLPGTAVDLPSAVGALPESVEMAVDMIDNHSPRMAQAVQDRRSLDRQYASQTGTFLPRVGLQVQGNHKYDVLGITGMSDDARAMVTVSYSFLNGGADVAVRNRIGARLRQADYELDRRRREVEQDIRADFQSLGAARQKIATINSEIESAQRVADLYKQQFREGKRSVFDMLDSQQVLFAARGSSVTNEIAMHLAEYRVLQKLGGLFDLVSVGEALPPLVVAAPTRK